MYNLPKLKYNYDEFEPFFDARTMEIHHTKPHQVYVDNLNAAMSELEKIAPSFAKIPLEDLLFYERMDELGDFLLNAVGDF